MGLTKVDSIELSRYILAKCGTMSHLKLQKLIYYVEAWHLAYFQQPLIDEDFLAWVHGPVVEKVWQKYRDETAPLFSTIGIKPECVSEVVDGFESKLEESQKDIILDVLKEYSDKSAYHLECLTHDEWPWIEARKGLPPDIKSSSKISKKTMLDFYRLQLYGEST